VCSNKLGYDIDGLVAITIIGGRSHGHANFYNFRTDEIGDELRRRTQQSIADEPNLDICSKRHTELATNDYWQ
jgi:hypothetical protein